jgi:hypothetical protein
MPAVPDAGAAPVAGAPQEGAATLDTLKAELDDLTSKIDSILSAVNPSGSEGGEGDVQVVDDDNPVADPAQGAPAPQAQAPAPAPQDNTVVSEDDIMFEIEDDMMMEDEINLDGLDEINLSEIEELDEIEIVDEDADVTDGEEIEEMRGMSHTVNRTAGNRKDFEKKGMEHGTHQLGESKNKNTQALYESKIDGLTQENKSLKESVKQYKTKIKEFENSFIELRENVQQMQVFNGKLAYANKLLTNGGITAAEKEKIAEAFDKVETVEEAKKLYNKLITEMKAIKSTPLNEDKLKTAKPMIMEQTKPSTQTQTIYESTEKKRWAKLAGISKETNDL